MPLYEYQCPGCGNFEVIQKFADAPLSSCPTCGRGVSKLPAAPAFHLKGSGWYVTDYARKGKGGGASESKAAATDSKAATGDSKATTGGSTGESGGSAATSG